MGEVDLPLRIWGGFLRLERVVVSGPIEEEGGGEHGGDARRAPVSLGAREYHRLEEVVGARGVGGVLVPSLQRRQPDHGEGVVCALRVLPQAQLGHEDLGAASQAPIGHLGARDQVVVVVFEHQLSA